MTRLDYTLNERPSDLGLEEADETTLRYHCFKGDVTFVVAEVDFSARRVPVLDFALTIWRAARAANAGESAEIDFTENEEKIFLDPTRTTSEVMVRATYADGAATVSSQALESEAERFLLRVAAELTVLYPTLKENAFVADLPLKIKSA